MGLTGYTLLGHSFGARIALQHAVDDPGGAARVVCSGGIGSKGTSIECPPNPAQFVGTLSPTLALSTGMSSLADAAGQFCPKQSAGGAFDRFNARHPRDRRAARQPGTRSRPRWPACSACPRREAIRERWPIFRAGGVSVPDLGAARSPENATR
jgi:pimeloyl-ACP methyl ester carboxylesterase